ncbi:MAG: porphobilinogen synthase [Deltaproteobacteria bacterium]|nr:porphobilinogen synthase [Deltaproteobacteria bacterium]
MGFPYVRMRRLRMKEGFRRMIRETRLSKDNLVYPVFVRPGENIKVEIKSMPGCYQLSIDKAVDECKDVYDLGIPAVILFGIPEYKDPYGSGAYADNGIIQRTIERIKRSLPDLVLIADVCLCEYTDHGHCGIIKNGIVDNDSTIEILAREALSYAKAGVDMVAPSDMMDGRIKKIREKLDSKGFSTVPIMAYSAKYSSSFYGPFREAAESAPSFGDRKSYQMDFCNSREAIREIELDIEEGADIVMVKPALCYLDIIAKVRERFDLPIAAYNVSGEYAMVMAAIEKGWLDKDMIIYEMLTAIKRAGADIIITYFAKDIVNILNNIDG